MHGSYKLSLLYSDLCYEICLTEVNKDNVDTAAMQHCMLQVAACTCLCTNLCSLLLQVLALAINSGLAAFPTGFDIAWSATGIYLWRPRCPESYIALGCIATSTKDPPSLTAMVCLHHTLGIEAPLGQCLVVKQQQEANQDAGDIGHLAEDPGANVWCVDNAAATFTVTTAEEGTNPQGALAAHAHIHLSTWK